MSGYMDRKHILERAAQLERQAHRCSCLTDAQRLSFEADRLRASVAPVAVSMFLPVFRN
ncbi:MAG: hypothetical protein QHC90_30940 [Shinella sp.]|nr:hypothetical protein [Shinella sp.]